VRRLRERAPRGVWAGTTASAVAVELRLASVLVGLLGAALPFTFGACDGGGTVVPLGSDAGDAAGADAGADLGVDVDEPFVEPAFPGLSADVEVLRDRTGVPHIYGETDADAMFGAGYAQAEDRLFQMDLTRRRYLGRRAEILGEGYVAEDRLVRLVGLPASAVATARRMQREHPEVFALVVAWVAGVNRRIDEVLEGSAPMPWGFGELGYLPERWSVVDAFGVGRLLLFGNANQLEFDILASIIALMNRETFERLPLSLPMADAFTVPPDERPSPRSLNGTAAAGAAGATPTPAGRLAKYLDAEGIEIPPDLGERIAGFLDTFRELRPGASNNWAVDGRHTANGRPILAGDPHQPLTSPSLFWPHHVSSRESGGTLDVVGFSFVGTPGVQLGHNDRVAWTATTTYPDFMDLWSVDLEEGGTAVRIGDALVPLRSHEETIAVRGGAPRRIRVDEVPGRGYLLPRDFTPINLAGPGRRLLFGWTGLRPTNEAAVFFGFDTARNLADFEAAAASGDVTAFNFVGGDATGIVYRTHSLVPDRGDPATMAGLPWTVLDGDDIRTFWTDAMLPLEKLPHSRGGARGFIVTANNEPFGFSQNGRLDDDPWYYGAFFDPGTRARRIEDELTRLVARGGITVEDMTTLQRDTYSLVADAMLPALARAMSARATDPALAEFRGDTELELLAARLEAWDRRMDRRSPDAVIFEGFSSFLTRQVLGDELALIYEPVQDGQAIALMRWAVGVLDRRFPGAEEFVREGRDLAVLRALDETRDWLIARFGGVDPAMYRWDMLHGTRFRPPCPQERCAPIDGGWVATQGSHGTVDVSASAFLSGGAPRTRLESTSGPIYRMVVSFAADGTPEAIVNFPRGVAGDPTSPHFADTVDDWVDGVYRPLLFRRAEVEADLESRRVIAR
jgi:penicillin amidase